MHRTLQPPRGRFAPTPSGALHLGSLRTALASALSVWSVGGRWLVRVEDLDRARTPEGATETLLDDLAWAGLTADEGPREGGPSAPYLQSARGERYRAALDALVADGFAYPCACSRRDLESAPVAPHTRETLYPGTCRALPPREVEARAHALGRGVAYRFQSARFAEAITWHDAVMGPQREDLITETGDFVLWRADGVAAYQLAVVVDDLAMGVTEVLRGDDLLPSTARQIALYRALGAALPRFGHLPLVVTPDGARFAKRLGSLAIKTLREAGVGPEALLVRLALSLGVTPRGADLRAWASSFALAKVPRAPWVIDPRDYASPRGAGGSIEGSSSAERSVGGTLR